jgi:hypothetical protein
VCPRIGGRPDRPNSPRHRLLQLSGIEDILSLVLDRREDRARSFLSGMVAVHMCDSKLATIDERSMPHWKPSNWTPAR